MASFQRDDTNAICKIPLSRRQVFDSMVWLHNKKGIYSIRSGYHIARKVFTKKTWIESLRGAMGQKIWKNLRRLNVPRKLKVFCWRACHEILPKRVNLVKRRRIIDDRCHYCKSVAEIAIHALWECGATQDVRSGSTKLL